METYARLREEEYITRSEPKRAVGRPRGCKDKTKRKSKVKAPRMPDMFADNKTTE